MAEAELPGVIQDTTEPESRKPVEALAWEEAYLSRMVARITITAAVAVAIAIAN